MDSGQGPGDAVTDEIVAFPSQEMGLELYDRLLAGDPLAPSDLASAYLEPLARWVVRMNPQSDASDCDTAAEDAILSLLKHPESYDPGRMPLETYLHMAAKRDLQNARRSENRHARRRADWGAVELSRAVGKYMVDVEADPARILELQDMVSDIIRKRPRLPAAALAGLTAPEIRALGLVQCGERRTDLFAAALDITHLPPERQRAEVKRVKDRLKLRLKRLGAADE